jgi:hypothetical protein
MDGINPAWLALHPTAALASQIQGLVGGAAGNNGSASGGAGGGGEERDEMHKHTQGTGEIEGDSDDDNYDGLESDPYVGGEEFEFADDPEADDDGEIEYMDNPYDQ